MAHAAFEVISSTSDTLVIRDLCFSGCLSVTNDAEHVVEKLSKSGMLLEGMTLLYFDSCGDLDELVHAGGKFVKFAPGPDR